MANNNPINYSDFFNDDGAIDKLIEKLNEVETTYKRLSKDVGISFENMSKKAKDFDSTTEDGRKEIEKLEIQLEKLIKQNKILKGSGDELSEQQKRAIKLAKEETKLIRKKNELTEDQTLKNQELKEEIREQSKVIKQNARDNLGLVGEYEKQSRLLIKLRKSYKDLAVAGKTNSDSARALLLEVTELDARLKDVDKSVGQTQRSVGDYRDAIKGAIVDTSGWANQISSAVDSTGALTEITDQLNQVLDAIKQTYSRVSKAMDGSSKATKENTVLSKKQMLVAKAQALRQKLLTAQLNKTKLAFKLLNSIMKASIIGIVVLAFGTFIASLTKTQAGLDKLKAITLSTSAIVSELTARIIKLAPAFIGLGKLALVPLKAIFGGIMVIINSLNVVEKSLNNAFAFGKAGKKAKKELAIAKKDLKGETDALVKTFSDIPNSIDDIASAFSVFDGLGDKLAKITKEADPLAKKLNLAELKSAEGNAKLEESIQRLAVLEAIEGDATRSLAERNKAIKEGAKIQKEIADAQVLSAENKLALFQEEQKFLLQSGEKNSEVKIKELELIQEVTKAKTEQLVKEIEIGTKSKTIDQDIAEQRLDILIDGFDKRKSLNEKIIDDENINFMARKELLAKTKILSDESLNAQVDILSKVAGKRIKIEELVGEKSAVELVKKIEGYGLSEVLNTRLFEVIRERQQAEVDAEEKANDLRKERLKKLEDSVAKEKELAIDNIKDIELKEKIKLQSEEKIALAEIEKRRVNAIGDVELTEKIEKEKIQLKEFYLNKFNKLKIKSLEAENEKELVTEEIKLLKEEKTQEEISEKLKKIKIENLQEEIDALEKIGDNADDKKLQKLRLLASKEKEIADKKEKEKAYIQKLASDTAFEIFNNRLQKEIDLTDKKIADENNQISKQEELAKNGLANTLAFEQGELAKLESQKLDAQKKQIQLEKVRSLYSGYVANTSSGTMTSSEALTRAFRDFGIITGLELGLSKLETGTGAGNFDDFFKSGENGSKNGNSLQNGIFRGDSHKAKSGGIPLLVERNEALLDSNRMKKFGQNNWNKLIHGIDAGAIGSDFMNNQVQSIPILGGVSVNFKGLENSINDVKKTIENKPIQEVNVEQMSDLYADFIDKKTVGNKITISRFRVPKKRF